MPQKFLLLVRQAIDDIIGTFKCPNQHTVLQVLLHETLDLALRGADIVGQAACPSEVAFTGDKGDQHDYRQKNSQALVEKKQKG